MIEKIRKPEKSRNLFNYTVYALIFGMIIATFVFMIPGLGDGGGAVNSAAEVGSKTISLRTYTDQLRRTRDQYSKFFNGELPPRVDENLKVQVLQSLVKQEVLNQYAVKNKMVASQVEIADFIRKDIPAFQEDGEFSYNNYSLYLQNTRSSAKKFEDMIGKDITSRRLYSFFESAIGESKTEAKLNENAKSLEVMYSYIKLDDEKLKNAVKVSGTLVSDFASDAANTEVLKKAYSASQTDYTKPSTAEVSYILIKDEKKAGELKSKLTKDNFSEFAKKESEDPISKARGGDLGLITKGEFSPEIEAKVFTMKKGEISEPFKTKLGSAIVYVKDITLKALKPFDEVKSEVAKKHLQKEGLKALKKKLSESLKSGSDYETILAEARLKWSEPQTYTLGASGLPGIGDAKDVVDKLLGLEKGAVYQNIVAASDSEYLIKLQDLKSKQAKPDLKVAQSDTKGRGNQLIDLVYENEKSALNIELNRQLLDQ